MTELSTAFCERNDTFDDPFDSLTVIIQSFGIGQWLKLQLANHWGISSNVDCILPATFLWRLYQQVLPATKSVTNSPFDRARLTFRVMHILKAQPNLSSEVMAYLQGPGDPDLRLYQLSDEIASLFDEYLMYRPTWMLDWENGQATQQGHAKWQAKLWQQLLEDIGINKTLHRAALHRDTLIELKAGRFPSGLPRRISVFGLSTMPPMQLQTFEALAEQIDVDIFFLNPCQHYWGDIISQKDKAKRSIRSLNDHTDRLIEEDYLEVGNPLLSSWGKQGREYLELLLDSVSAQSHESFTEHSSASALDYVKNDILNLTYGGDFGLDATPNLGMLIDSSLQIHACHSRLREVEVLHDQIKHAITQQPDIALHEIIVMMPSIADYAPFIQSVFTGSMPFRIADQSPIEQGSIVTSFLTLLNLSNVRLTATEVLDLLEVPAIHRHFELNAGDLETISYWIAHSGIRWEISGQQKQARWNVPAESMNTWEFGLNRLLLGFAMSPDQGAWQGTLPLEVTPDQSELLGKLCYFIDLIDDYQSRFEQARTPTHWQHIVGQLLEDFFDPIDDELLSINAILQGAEILSSDCLESHFEATLSVDMIRHYFEESLAASDSRAGFISGGITFATLVPMRSIPHRMVCLLGLNDGEYPRDSRPRSFDVMASENPQRGDRSKKMDDRYLFLEALISAQDIFYVSFIGRGVRDDKPRPPSVIVSEWQQYLSAVFNAANVIHHPLQPFSPRYFQQTEDEHFPRSFNLLWFEALKAAASGANKSHVFVNEPLEPDDALVCTSIDQLDQFFRHSGKYFLQQRLRVYFDDNEQQLNDTESFELDPLERFSIADDALSLMVQGDAIDSWAESLALSGQVMSGRFGRLQIDREIQRATNIYQSTAPYLFDPPADVAQSIYIDGQEISLGTAKTYGNKLVNYRAGNLRAHQLFSVWIQHLAANATGPDYSSVCIFRGKNDAAEILELTPIEASASVHHLSQLISLYNQGVNFPLLLPPETSRAFVAQLQSPKPELALTKALETWDLDLVNADGKDRVWRRLFSLPDDLNAHFRDNAILMWQPLFDQLARP